MLENMFLFNKLVADGILLLEFAVAIMILSYFYLLILKGEEKQNLKNSLNNYIDSGLNFLGFKYRREKYISLVIFLFSLASVISSFIYSEVFMQIPCALCWFQRAFLYGILILSGIAFFQKNTFDPSLKIKLEFQLNNILAFSIVGFLFAIYNHAEQILALYGTSLPCPASSADCSKLIIYEYGHITFPWVAAVLFAFFIIIILLQKKLK